MFDKNRNIHRPSHIYFDNTMYFVTARTIDGDHHFNTDMKKKMIFNCLKEIIEKLAINLYAWVIVNNHYHLLLKVFDGKDVFQLAKHINGKSSHELNIFEGKQGRKIWFQYRDWCIRNEIDFYKHFNYIHHNPVKHGYVKNQDEVLNYYFCSYRQWYEKKGDEWLLSCFSEYPIIDFTIENNA